MPFDRLGRQGFKVCFLVRISPLCAVVPELFMNLFNMTFSFFQKICKKFGQIEWVKMNPENKKILKQSIAVFYANNRDKGRAYPVKHFKHCGLSERSVFATLKRFDKHGDVNHNPEIIIKMMDQVRPRAHYANKNGLFSLIKYWTIRNIQFLKENRRKCTKKRSTEDNFE